MTTIDLWHGKLVGGEIIDQDYWRFLDESERHHALRLKRQELQSRYVEAHGKMRGILARYLAIGPEQIVIGRDRQGKPYLPECPERVFNLSHSADRFVLAVSMNCRLGVDIELCKFRNSLDGLVGKCFAIEERQYWQALPEHRKNLEFYRFWTRKEAFVKATGRGISLGLEQCVIDPDNPTGMLRAPENLGSADWCVADIDLGEGIACAVVSDCRIETITKVEMNHECVATL